MDDLDQHRQTEPGQLADFFACGDWCAVGSRGEVTPSTGPPLAAFNWLLSLDAMVAMSELTGNNTGVAYYQGLSIQMRKVWHERFYNSTAGMYYLG
jgi:hypothetical protein